MATVRRIRPKGVRITEEEARARYHLGEAFKALRKVTGTPVAPGVKPLGSMYAFGAISGHFDALNILAQRVLERERPEGWARPDQRS
jgi:hypothetical protein